MNLVNLSVLLASLVLCASLLEVVSRLFFDAPPSVVIENLPSQDAVARPPQETEHVTLEGEKIISRGVADWGFYVSTHTGRRLRRSVSGMVKPHRLSKIDVEISTNSLGYRYGEIDAKRDRDYRILVLGDSITLGDYVAVDQTYPAIVERILNEGQPESPDSRNFQVINAGVGAIDLQNEFAILMETGLSVEPDVVLVGLYLNDAYQSPVLEVTRLPAILSWSHFVRLASWRLDVFRDQYEYEDSSEWDEDALAQAREQFLADYSVKEDHTQKSDDWRTSREAFYFRAASILRDWGYAWTDDYWRKVVPTLELMKRVGEEQGFELVVLLFPIRMQVESELLIDEPQRNFERHMTELGLAHLDLLPLLREKYQRDGENVFYDHCHYRPEGYEYFSSGVAQFLLREVISR